MRHRKKVKKLGRTASHRRATLRNMATALINHHQIKTTLGKAKAARSYVEKLITTGKKDSVHARRQAFKLLQNRTLVKKLFDEIAPTFSDRNGGYTRVVKLGRRTGDGAEMAVLQLVGFEQLIIDEQEKQKQKRKERVEKKKAKEAEEQAEAAEVVTEEPVEKEKKEEEEAKKEPKQEKKEAKEEKPKEAKAKKTKKETKPAKAKAKKKETAKSKSGGKKKTEKKKEDKK
jgi:large subunit ribosomal protein L17